MWFMNKIANPFVRLVLRSPLHRMMSGSVLLISYRGKKSGKEYTLPVQYAQEEHCIYIVTGMPDKKNWWRNLRSETEVRLRLRGDDRRGKAVVLQGEGESAHIVRGLELYMRRFPPSARLHDVSVNADGAFNQDDLREAAGSTVVVFVKLDERAIQERST